MAYVFFFFFPTNRSSERGRAFLSATEANEKGCAGVGSIPLREPSTRSRRGSRRVEGPGDPGGLARPGPARRKHGAPEGRARSSPWNSWCCSLVPWRTSPWSSGLLSFHSLQLRLRARQKHARLYRCPSFFFSSPSGGGGEHLTKISRILRNFRPRTFSKLGSKSRHKNWGWNLRAGAAFHVPPGAATATEVTEGARPLVEASRRGSARFPRF